MKRYLVLQLHNTYINHMNKNIVCTFAYGTNHLLQSKLITNRYLQKKKSEDLKKSCLNFF